MNSSELRDKIRDENCQRCPLHATAQHVCLIGLGSIPAELMLVGEAPGEREDNIHKPFQGRSGRLLDSILETLSLRRESIFISNAVHCRPPENATPTAAQITTCSSVFLRREISHVKPKLILALGKVAAQALTQSRNNLGWYRNQIHKTAAPFLEGIPVVVTYHPAAALRTDYFVDLIVRDFEWALKILRGEIETDSKFVREQVSSVHDIPGIRDSKVIYLDLETDGFDPFLKDRHIISAQISPRRDAGYYIRWEDRIRDEVRTLLDNRQLVVGNHNIKFDMKWLEVKHGIRIAGKIRDTMIGAHLYDENLPGKDLDTVGGAYGNMPPHKETAQQYAKKHKCSWRDIPLDIAIPYGCDDVIKTRRIDDYLSPKIKGAGLGALYKWQMKAIRLFKDIEINGFKVDVKLIDEMADIYEKKIRITQKQLFKVIGTTINPKSSQQVGKVLYKTWKLPALGKPKSWKDPPQKNTAEATMLKLKVYAKKEGLPKVVEFIDHVLSLRELYKLLNTYILGIGDFIREGDLVHPSFKLHGTVTGRPSCTDPNFQNIPREGDIKRLFISRYGTRGMLVQVDLSQAELRFAAHYAQEKTLLRYFREGRIDIHRKVAAAVLKKPESEVTDKERKKAKRVNFGILYGAWADKLVETGDFDSIRDAEEFIKSWNEEFPGWNKHVWRTKKRCIRDGYVKSIFGRIRHLPIIDPNSKQGREALRQAINSPIQGGVGDYNVICTIQTVRALRKAKVKEFKVVNMVHDCMIIDTVDENIEQIAKIARQCFRHPDLSDFDVELTVPMDVEVQVGRNWKAMSVYPED